MRIFGEAVVLVLLPALGCSAALTAAADSGADAPPGSCGEPPCSGRNDADGGTIDGAVDGGAPGMTEEEAELAACVRTVTVSPDGSDASDGVGAPLRTVSRAAELVEPGDCVLVREGIYYESVRLAIAGTAEQPILLRAFPGEHVILDGSQEATPLGWDSPAVLALQSGYQHVRRLEVRNGRGVGVQILEGGSSLVADVETHHHNKPGLLVYSSSNNRLVRVISHDNYDPQTGGQDADGIEITSGDGESTGNVISDCHSYANSDDGVDTWTSIGTRVERCRSHDNGSGASGNGNGFKLGPGGSNVVRYNVADHNQGSGFDTNGGGGNLIEQNTAFENGVAAFASYTFPNTFRNNLAYGSGVGMYDDPVSEHNSWDLGVTDPGFAGTDPAVPGSFLRLASGSAAIDRGLDLGLPYTGLAPDLGAFERP